MSDPARVVRAVNEVRAALAGWQEAATEAIAAAREERQRMSATVQESGESAVRVRTRAANLAQDLARLESSVAETRASLAAAAAAVERRSRAHHELTDHVTHTRAAWIGHVERAEHDHDQAVTALSSARQTESVARRHLEGAQAQVGGAQSDTEWSAAQAELGRAAHEYNLAVASRRGAEASEEEQRARVLRCRRALGLAQQAAEVLESTAGHVGSAVQAVQTGQQRLSEVESATNTAHAHLVRMAGYADEAVSHANQADQHLTSATHHLSEAESWYQRGSLLAMDARDEMADVVQELQRIDAPMDGGDAQTESSVETIPGVSGVERLQRASQARADELQASLPDTSKGRVTMGVGIGRDPNGKLRTVVATSERKGYLRRGVTLNPGEELAMGFGHAESKIIHYMSEHGIEPSWIAAGRPICQSCAATIRDSGALPSGPLRPY